VIGALRSWMAIPRGRHAEGVAFDWQNKIGALWYFAWSSQNQPRMARIHAKKIKNQCNLCNPW
ncbi:MAG: hypothetical protein U9R05_04650, partial [Chloroflexota bacterium]|nr:hypothetical protein [Chloroflexota bacterium]